MPVIGSTIPLEVLVTDVNDAPVDPSAIILTITQPDGTSVTPTPTHVSTGTYLVYFVPTLTGRHNWYWEATNPTAAKSGAFDIDPAIPGQLISVADFILYLNNPALDQDRATFILGLAQTLCQTVVNPLPDGAEIVVLDVAERAFSNPTAIRSSPVGMYSEGVGPFSEDRPGVSGGGLWLTQANKDMLRSLAGLSGGAFTIDTLPADYTLNVPIWDSADTFFGP